MIRHGTGRHRAGRARALVALVAGALAAILVLGATAGRPIATPDSFSYLGAARSLADGHGLRIPTTSWDDDDSTSALHQFPPGYPIALALPIRLGASSSAAARAVAAMSALVTVGSVAWLADAVDGVALAVVAPIVLLALRGVAGTYLTALSEPLFLAATAATVVLMAVAPRRPWSYGLTAAVADVVRYAGVSLVGAATVWAIRRALDRDDAAVPNASPRRARVATLATAAAGAALPGLATHVLWMVHVRLDGDVPVGGAFAWSPGVGRTLLEGARTLRDHLAPVPVPSPWRAVAASGVALTAALLVARGWRDARDRSTPLARHALGAALLLAACYAAVVLWARAFVGSTIPFDDRVLAPLLLVLGIAVLVAMGASRALRGAGVVLGALWLAAGTWQSVHALHGALAKRGDYAAPTRREAPIARWIRRAGAEHALFTNDPAAVFFDAGRPARELPEALASDTIAAFDTTLRATDGVIVAYVHDVGFGPVADPTALAHALALCPAVASPEGTVWIAPGPGRCAR